MAAKMLAATQNIYTNKQNQLKITKETLISNFCCSCVRLPVHRFTFSMLYENIHVKDICGYFQCAPFPRLQTGKVVLVLSFDP